MNKGFTLVELLAVIVILAILTYLTGISVTSVLKNAKKSTKDVQIQIIKDSTEAWIVDNFDKIPDSSESCSYLTLEELKEYGMLDDQQEESLEGLSDDMVITITVTNTTKYTVDVGVEDYSTCTKIY